MDNQFIEKFGKFRDELEKRGLYICLKVESNQRILDKRLGNSDIDYATYRNKTKWNKELAEFMTFLNSYREMSDEMFSELCFPNALCIMKENM